MEQQIYVSVGNPGAEIFVSQIVGHNSQGGRVFGKVKVLKLEEPIKKGSSLVINGREIIRDVKKILTRGPKLFVIKTSNKRKFEVGFV